MTVSDRQEIYVNSYGEWSNARKRAELDDAAARFLFAFSVAEDGAEEPVAFSHFRFEFEGAAAVLYVWELQLTEPVQRKGLGKFIMQLLELIGRK